MQVIARLAHLVERVFDVDEAAGSIPAPRTRRETRSVSDWFSLAAGTENQ